MAELFDVEEDAEFGFLAKSFFLFLDVIFVVGFGFSDFLVVGVLISLLAVLSLLITSATLFLRYLLLSRGSSRNGNLSLAEINELVTGMLPWS